MYLTAYADAILVVGAIVGYDQLRKILGGRFLVNDIGTLKHEGSVLGFFGLALIRFGDEVGFQSSVGCGEERWGSSRFTRARGSETIGEIAAKVTRGLDNALTLGETPLYRRGCG